LRRHVPGRVRPDATDLHDAGEGAELEPAREHLAILELVVAAGVGAPDRDAHEGGALLADDRAAEAEVGPGADAERLAARDVAAPEDRPALRAPVAGTREQHEVTVGVDAGERVVVDLRLQGRVVVAHLASGAAVETDVGPLGGGGPRASTRP